MTEWKNYLQKEIVVSSKEHGELWHASYASKPKSSSFVGNISGRYERDSFYISHARLVDDCRAPPWRTPGAV